MKTPRQILDENDLTGKLKCYDYEGNQRDYFDITYAMKVYAKEWVIIAVALAGAGRTVEANEATIKLLEGKIDAQ